MEVVLKVCALSIVGAITVVLLRRTLTEMSVAASLVLLGALVFCAAGAIGRVIELVFELAEYAGLSENLLTPLIKALGISIITKLSSDLCRESGVVSAASYIELLGGAVAISFAIPLMFGLLGQITS